MFAFRRLRVPALWLPMVLLGCEPSTPHPPRLRARNGEVVRWYHDQVTLEVSAPPAGRTQEEIVGIAQRAVEAWGSVGPTVKVKSTDSRQVRQDGRNVLIFGAGSSARAVSPWSPPPFPATMSGRTHTHSRPSGTSGELEITEADIEINSLHFRWDGPLGKERLQAVLVHEIGHFLGLDDVCRGVASETSRRPEHSPPPCNEESLQKSGVMYPGAVEPGRRLVLVPTDSERRALEAVYAPNGR